MPVDVRREGFGEEWRALCFGLRDGEDCRSGRFSGMEDVTLCTGSDVRERERDDLCGCDRDEDVDDDGGGGRAESTAFIAR